MRVGFLRKPPACLLLVAVLFAGCRSGPDPVPLNEQVQYTYDDLDAARQEGYEDGLFTLCVTIIDAEYLGDLERSGDLLPNNAIRIQPDWGVGSPYPGHGVGKLVSRLCKGAARAVFAP